MHESVLDEHARDLQHALLVANGERAAVRRDVERVVRLQRNRRKLRERRLRDLVERHHLALQVEVASVESGQVEQLGRQLLEPQHLLSHRLQELKARLLIQVLVVEQLQEAPEREHRRTQLVRRVRDELPARVLELHEPAPHALERPRELADLVVTEIDYRLVEHTVGDALGSPFEAPDPSREHPRAGVADDEDEAEHEGTREQEPALDEVDVPERAIDRRGQEEHAPVVADRCRGLDEPLAVAMRRAALRNEEERGFLRNRVVGDVRRARASARVGGDAERLRRLGQRVEENDAGIRGRSGRLEEVGIERMLGELRRKRGHASLEIVQP